MNQELKHKLTSAFPALLVWGTFVLLIILFFVLGWHRHVIEFFEEEGPVKFKKQD